MRIRHTIWVKDYTPIMFSVFESIVTECVKSPNMRSVFRWLYCTCAWAVIIRCTLGAMIIYYKYLVIWVNLFNEFLYLSTLSFHMALLR